MDEVRLSERVIAELRPFIGQQLLSVVYWCLHHEATAQDILAKDFYFGGEVELQFGKNGSLFLTWDENAGWPNHFSIRTSRQTCFRPHAL